MTASVSSTTGRDRVDWGLVGGVLGIGFVIIFILGVVVLQGETPLRSDSIEDIREYWTDDGDTYLVGDYLAGIAFTLFFLPYLIILRRVLTGGAGWSDLLARVGFYAGIIAMIWGGAASFFWGALALGAQEGSSLDDSSVQALMDLDAYAFSGMLFFVGLFLGAYGVSIILSGRLWRWIGIIGLIGFVGSYIGAAWPIEGDEEGALAAFGIAGYIGMPLFILLVSISLLVKRGELADLD